MRPAPPSGPRRRSLRPACLTAASRAPCGFNRAPIQISSEDRSANRGNSGMGVKKTSLVNGVNQSELNKAKCIAVSIYAWSGFM